MKSSQIVHLKELQFRSFQIFIGFLFNFIFCQTERINLVYVLILPLKKIVQVDSPMNSENLGNGFENFVYLSVTEAFSVQVQLSFMVALFLSIPIFWVQSQFFFSTGLQKKEQEIFRNLIGFSQVLLVSFVQLTQEYLLPQAYSFFISFGFGSMDSLGNLSQLPSFGNQVFLFLDIVFAIILTSQLPIFFFLVLHWGWVNPKFMIKSRPFFILFFLIWAALISPPDLVSQLIIFFPLFLFYELGVFSQILFSTSRNLPQK